MSSIARAAVGPILCWCLLTEKCCPLLRALSVWGALAGGQLHFLCKVLCIQRIANRCTTTSTSAASLGSVVGRSTLLPAAMLASCSHGITVSIVLPTSRMHVLAS